MKGASRGVLEVGQVRRPRACLASTHSGGPGSPRHGRRAAKAARIGEGAALPSAPGSYGLGDRNRRHGAPSGERACAGRADATNADKWRKLRTLVCAASGLMVAPPRRSIPLARMSGLPDMRR